MHDPRPEAGGQSARAVVGMVRARIRLRKNEEGVRVIFQSQNNRVAVKITLTSFCETFTP
jgi:hypothetical protein